MSTGVSGRPENRRARRFHVEQVVAIKSLEGRFDDTAGMSRDVSACGVFAYTDDPLPVGALVEIVMMLPDDSILAPVSYPLRGFGTVVRLEARRGRYGVAVALDRVNLVA
jgi:hypothetical protein